jgi:acyl carrier protein
MNTVKQEIRNFILENFYFDQDGALEDEDSFMDRGIIDSTGILELVLFVEERFSFELDSDDLTPENLDSIARLTRFISARLDSPLALQNDAVSAEQGQML